MFFTLGLVFKWTGVACWLRSFGGLVVVAALVVVAVRLQKEERIKGAHEQSRRKYAVNIRLLQLQLKIHTYICSRSISAMATAAATATAMAKRARGCGYNNDDDDVDERAHLPRGNWTSCNIAAAFLQHRLAHGHDSCAAERQRQGEKAGERERERLAQGRPASAAAAFAEPRRSATQRVDRPHPPKFESVCN